MQERLFQKAERLAPDLFGEVTHNVERERKAHEAKVAAKVLDPASILIGRSGKAFLQTFCCPRAAG